MPKSNKSKSYLTIALEKHWGGLRRTRSIMTPQHPGPFVELSLDLSHLKCESTFANIFDIATLIGRLSV